jgi:hypothetical protein
MQVRVIADIQLYRRQGPADAIAYERYPVHRVRAVSG